MKDSQHQNLTQLLLDGMFLVGGGTQTRHRFERCIPHAQLAPACEAHEDRIPIAVLFRHIAPGRAGAQNPKNAVDCSPLVGNGRTTFATVRKQGVEHEPLLATVLWFSPYRAASSLSGAFDRCIAVRTACVVVAQP